MELMRVIRRLARAISDNLIKGRLGRLICATGRHSRSRSRTRREDGDLISRCRRCSQLMVRGDSGDWRIK